MGIRTTNLPRRYAIDELIANITADGVQETARVPTEALANQLAGTGPFIFGNTVYALTKAALDAFTPPNERMGGVVLTGDDAGYYARAAGVWVFGRGFPDTLAKLTVIGGTANAVQASASPGVNPSVVTAFYIDIEDANTAPVTISINGAAPISAFNYEGGQFAPGEWAGRLFLSNEGTSLKALTADPSLIAAAVTSTAADRLAAEAAANDAEFWAEQAEQIAGITGIATEPDTEVQDEAVASNTRVMTVLRTLQAVRNSLRYDGFVTPKMFGALGEYDLGTFSGPDEVSYIQQAVDACLEETGGKGGEVLFPPGNWYTESAAIVLPNGNVPGTGGDFGRVSLRGYGAGASQILVNNAMGVQLGIETGSDVHRYQHISDLHFRALGGAKVHTAIGGGGLAYMHLFRSVIENFEYGLNVTDMLSSEIDHCVIRGNEYGLVAGRGAYSHPNAISARATKFSASGTWAAFLARPSAFTMFGGTVEGNGLNTGVAKAGRGGILITNPGNEGATSLQAYGTYFEFNDGIADIYSTSGVGERGVAMGLLGCTFARISAAQFVDQHILMNHEERASLGVFGCGFGSYNDWVPGSSGPVWGVSDAVDVSEAGNFFQNVSERPAVPLNQSVSLSTQVSARGYVDANGALVVGSRGIAGVSKSGAGSYAVTFIGQDVHPRHVEASSRGTVGIICVTSTSVDGSGRTVANIATYDLAGILADRPFTVSSSGGW